jgi:uncharacterized membrane protein YraQ (UPF0718 family)
LEAQTVVRASKAAQAATQTAVTFAKTFPIILGILALASFVTAAIPLQSIFEALPMESVLGPVFGALVGSVAAGHPLTSYVLAGELTAAGASLATITALIVSWVTVGIVNLPAEAAILGTRFALWRNAISFALAIMMAYVIAVLVPVVP